MITAAIFLCLAPTAIDGDTLRCGITDTRVRVFGIQAPETGASGAAASKVHLQGLVNGGLICAVRGTSYNRVVGVCSNWNRQDIGLEQIKAGHAVEWCRYSKNEYGNCS